MAKSEMEAGSALLVPEMRGVLASDGTSQELQNASWIESQLHSLGTKSSISSDALSPKEPNVIVLRIKGPHTHSMVPDT